MFEKRGGHILTPRAEIQYAKLAPEVRAYVDNLRAQLFEIVQAHHQTSVKGLIALLNEEEISSEERKRISGLIHALRETQQLGKTSDAYQRFVEEELEPAYHQAANFAERYAEVLPLPRPVYRLRVEAELMLGATGLAPVSMRAWWKNLEAQNIQYYEITRVLEELVGFAKLTHNVGMVDEFKQPILKKLEELQERDVSSGADEVIIERGRSFSARIKATYGMYEDAVAECEEIETTSIWAGAWLDIWSEAVRAGAKEEERIFSRFIVQLETLKERQQVDTYGRLVVCMAELGKNFTPWLERMNACVMRFPEGSERYRVRLQLAFIVEKWVDQRPLYEELKDSPLLEEEDISLRMEYAALCVSLGKLEEAKELLEGLDEDENIGVLPRLAQAYAKAGYFDKAFRLIDQLPDDMRVSEKREILKLAEQSGALYVFSTVLQGVKEDQISDHEKEDILRFYYGAILRAESFEAAEQWIFEKNNEYWAPDDRAHQAMNARQKIAETLFEMVLEKAKRFQP